MAGELDARRAGVGRDAPGGIDDRHLAELRAVVGGRQLGERVGGRDARRQEVEHAGAVRRLADRLGRDRADARARHETTDPTLNQCDWTATPTSPDWGSRATME